jgi:hypothetical protein
MNDFNLKKFLIENKITRNSQLLSENVDFNKWSNNNTHDMEIVFNPAPRDPESLLYDNEDEEDLTKQDFWESDVYGSFILINQGYISEIITAVKLKNGTWNFSWDVGDIDGFIEGEDFNFVPLNEIPEEYRLG